jgi:plasmid stabilization system protein ParE
MPTPYRVRITANFQANLDAIRQFLVGIEAAASFDPLIMSVFDDIIPNLERFPRMGRDFLSLEPLSEEGRAKIHALRTKVGAGTEIREYISGDYLSLYAIRVSRVFLLAIRHHRQLSFDLRSHWL